MWVARRPVVSIFVLAMAFRLIPYGFLVSTPDRFLYGPDSVEYDRLARNLITHQRFSLAADPPFAPDLSRTPVFPAFIGGVYALAGHSLPVVILMNITLGSVVCVIVYRLGREMFERVAYGRFQVPVAPFLGIVGGVGAAWLWSAVRPQRAGRPCG